MHCRTSYCTRSNVSQRLSVPIAATTALGLYSLQPTPAFAKSADDLPKVKEAILEVIENDMEKRGDGTSLYGTFIRLAWHCAGTYSAKDGTGGSNGARMRYDPEASWGANAGLGGTCV